MHSLAATRFRAERCAACRSVSAKRRPSGAKHHASDGSATTGTTLKRGDILGILGQMGDGHGRRHGERWANTITVELQRRATRDGGDRRHGRHVEPA
jgi:hypothetical protein